MCLRCQLNTFPFSEQSDSDISLINSDFNNFLFFKDTNIFQDENLNSLFTECNSIETPFNDSNHPESIDFKYYDINNFNKLSINKNSSFPTLRLNIASLSEQNFWSLLKHYFDIIGISEHKINNNSMNVDFTLLGYTFYFNKTENSQGGTDFFISDSLTFKQPPDLLIGIHFYWINFSKWKEHDLRLHL